MPDEAILMLLRNSNTENSFDAIEGFLVRILNPCADSFAGASRNLRLQARLGVHPMYSQRLYEDGPSKRRSTVKFSKRSPTVQPMRFREETLIAVEGSISDDGFPTEVPRNSLDSA